jgi:hypothetical protein
MFIWVAFVWCGAVCFCADNFVVVDAVRLFLGEIQSSHFTFRICFAAPPAIAGSRPMLISDGTNLFRFTCFLLLWLLDESAELGEYRVPVWNQ